MQHGAMDACPLCGSKLISSPREKTLPQLHD
jgi:DNA-directed RNA polymerase subunit RPC12/RpoP